MEITGLMVIGTAAYNGRNYNLIYEKDQELVWLDYASSMHANWDQYMKWALELNTPGVLTCSFDPGVRVTWNSDWRLPNTVDGPRSWGCNGKTTAGFNITTSEMGHLYYKTLANQGCYDTRQNIRAGWPPDAAWGLQNTGPFVNLYPDTYWSGTEYAAYTEHAWAFSFQTGAQNNGIFKHLGKRVIAMAVRSGKAVSA